MYIRKIAAAAGFACGAALAFAPVSAADTATAASSFWPGIDGILAGLPAADTPALNLAISFDGISLLSSGDATATTVSGQYGFALAYGDHASAYAAGGFGNSASAIGTYALADAGSKTEGATGFNFNSATDIGNNADPSTYAGAPDGAYAGGGSLIGNTDALTASSNNTAQVIGNIGNNPDVTEQGGGNSGSFAGDSGLIGAGHVAGSGNTAYTSGNILGANDGSAAVGGSSNSAFTNGTETGNNEGAFAGLGNYNSATADTNYTTTGSGVSAIGGNGNYASVYGPNNSTADAGGTSSLIGQADHAGNGNVAIVSDPFGTTADNASAGSSATTSGNSDLAAVLLAHGDANATGGNNLYDIISLFGNSHSAAADSASVADLPGGGFNDPGNLLGGLFNATLASEINALNSTFSLDVSAAGIDPDKIITGEGPFPFDTILATNTNETFNTLVFGLNPDNVTDGIPGSYDVFNGAFTEFSNAFNVGLFSLLDPTGTFDPSDIFGLHADFLAGGTTSAISDFLQLGVQDLLGYFDPSAVLGGI